MSKTILFQTVLFSISTQFSSIWPIDRTLSGATTPGQSGPGSNGNEGVLHIPQCSSITGASPSDCLVSYNRTLVWWWWWGVLLCYRDVVGVFYSPSWLGKIQDGRWCKFCSMTVELDLQWSMKSSSKKLGYWNVLCDQVSKQIDGRTVDFEADIYSPLRQV